MEKRRVVITGMGAVSPYGKDCNTLWNGLKSNVCALQALDSEKTKNVNFKNAGIVPKLNEKIIPREVRRAMSPMSIYATLAAWEAIEMAGYTLENLPENLGVCASSSLGSTFALEDFFREYIENDNIESVRSTVFFKVMSHTIATNISMACKLNATLLAPSAACATGLVSMGMAYEDIAYGKEECMLAGAADEYHILTSATFDKLGAASYALDPQKASRPFDKGRDGLVISEGAGIVFLESLESAKKRNATIYAEVSGYATKASSTNIAFPDSHIMSQCMEKSLKSAKLNKEDINYINAHATATLAGDVAEAQAIEILFKNTVPTSSLKGYMGHTLAASGALESIASVFMLQENLLLPNFNLDEIDPLCNNIKLLQEKSEQEVTHILKNSFALGGIYASLILSKYTE